jgi:adenosylhomocysteine nucleosidase
MSNEAGESGGRWSRLAPSPLAAEIGLVVALGMEIQPFVSALAKVRRYRAADGGSTITEGETAGGRVVAVALAGMGRTAVRQATLRLIAGHRPRWIVSAGFGGALDPSLALGDIILPREIVPPEPDAPRLRVDLELGPVVAARPGRRIQSGRLATVDHVIRTAAEKAALRERTGADVVDMETSAVAAVCHERSQPFFAVRVISDDATADLPPEVLTILGPTGSFRLGAAVGALWRRPASLKELWGLREAAIEASDRLAAVLPALFDQLP